MSERIEPGMAPVAASAPAPVAPASGPDAALSSASRSGLDQLARIEDKMARMEEKFARMEALVTRGQDGLDRAATRVEGAARSVDATELANGIRLMRAEVARAPRLGGLVLAGLATAFAAAILFILLVKFLPGLAR